MNSYKNNLITIACLFIVSFLLVTQLMKAETISSYELSQKALFNQISHYSVAQTMDNSLYQPTGNWVGRLILPEKPLFDNNIDAVILSQDEEQIISYPSKESWVVFGFSFFPL